MFGLGMGELLVILVLALIVLGPKRLPDIASSLGRAIRGFRKATQELSDQLEVDESVKQPFRELKAALRDEPAPLVAQRPAQTVPVAPGSTASVETGATAALGAPAGTNAAVVAPAGTTAALAAPATDAKPEAPAAPGAPPAKAGQA